MTDDEKKAFIWFLEEMGRLVKGVGSAFVTLAEKLKAAVGK